MFETLFGAEMPLAVRFFIAFLIVLGLIGAAAWAVRRFGGGRLGSVGARGRQPRLAVIDQTPVDARRRLILIRRDNVEHLLMIGGPSDLVVEPNIVRAVAAPRDLPAPRAPGLAEALPRAVPLPEVGNWPLQPEPVPAPRPAPRPVHSAAEDTIAWPLQPEPAPQRSQRETLTSLADELAARPAATREHAPVRAHAPEPRIVPVAPVAPSVAEAQPDQGLFDMAHRLESAMRRPAAPVEARVQAPAPRMAPPAEHAAPAEAVPPPPRAARAAAEPKAARAEAKPAAGKSMYESLEQEMASLLGRPAGKT